MKRIMTLILAAGMLLGASTATQAIDFNAKGQWLMGFSVGEGSLVKKSRTDGAEKKHESADKFSAAQRIRLQLDAVANENLSGTVYFEIGDTTWGKADQGGAVGADGKIVEVKNAYIDFTVPDTELKLRMGIQNVAVPSVVGASSILDDDAAAVAASYQFNENVGLTFAWARLLNDNYKKGDGAKPGNDKDNYLDNLDLFILSMPLTFDGIKATPWAMYGVIGQNVLDGTQGFDGYMGSGYGTSRWNAKLENRKNATNTSAFWAGLPVQLTLWDPLNIEASFEYGFVEGYYSGSIDRKDASKRFDTQRSGWLAKALVEYKMDWGTPGIFGWYGSGDDDNPKNGSERMPSVSPSASMTSFMGDGNLGWSSADALYDRTLTYAGTWGFGLQVADMSFVEDLKHTFRVALIGGTNSPTMAKYANSPFGFSSDYDAGGNEYGQELYLTTNDKLLEFNLVNSYQMYENLEVNFELGYVVNMVDHDTWKKANGNSTFQKQDAYKAQLVFCYSF